MRIIILFRSLINLTIKVNELSFISQDEVPNYRRTKWDEILHNIPAGKALVLREEQVTPSSVRQALRRRQDRGQFVRYNIVVRGSKKNQITYIVNPK